MIDHPIFDESDPKDLHGTVDLKDVQEKMRDQGVKDSKIVLFMELSVIDIGGEAAEVITTSHIKILLLERPSAETKVSTKNFLHWAPAKDGYYYQVWHENGGMGKHPGWYCQKADPFGAPHSLKGPYPTIGELYRQELGGS